MISNLGRQHISLPKGTIITTLELVEHENYLTIMELTSTAKKTKTTLPEEKLNESGEETEEERGSSNDLDLSGTNFSNLLLKLFRFQNIQDVLLRILKALTAKDVEHTIDTDGPGKLLLDNKIAKSYCQNKSP